MGSTQSTWSQKIKSIGPPVPELWLSLNLAVKEQNERVYKCGRECNFFCRECKFAFSQLDFMPRGMICSILGHFVSPFSPRKSDFFQRKGRKRVKEWREVTFMKEWVKALYIFFLSYIFS